MGKPDKIARHVVRPDWVLCPETQRLLALLPEALFVGGCVRNTLLGKNVEDIDLASPLTPDEVITRLKPEEGVTVIPTGLQHGTVTVMIGDYKYEVTTLRNDKETDGRHAVVAYTDDWVEDARRRDFTINTFLMDGQGNIYDPLGCGLDDLDARRIVFVGDAAKRIEEDHLRILRFFRFSALYGREFDVEGLKACRAAADTIDKLSKERVTQEYFKIMASDAPYEVLDIMFQNDVLKAFDFEAYDAEFFEHFCTFQSRYGLNALPPRLFVAAGMDFSNVKSMERYVLFPKVFIRDMQAINGSLTLSDLSCDSSVRESVYRFGRSATAQALMIELVQDRVMNGYAPIALEIIQSWDVPNFPVTGADLMAQGFEQGPALGAELERLEEEWIKSGFKS